MVVAAVSIATKIGAAGYGALIGWYVYFVNRYRTDKIQVTDIATVGGALGGAAVLKLFPAQTTLFGFYGIGLAVGFFGYFVALLVFVAKSKGDFDARWFLDGRRKSVTGDLGYGDQQHSMASRSGGA
jgi:hypothetical protein